MTHFFQWQTLVPRLLAVAVVLLAVQYGLSRHLRQVAERSSKSVAHSPLDIKYARVGMFGQKVVFSDLQLAGPNAGAQSLIEADHVVLDVASKPLLYKQAVIDRGTVSGLRFGAATSSDGRKSREAKLLVNDAAAQRVNDWLRRLDDRFGKNWVKQLRSVRLADELCAQWPDRSAVLEQRVRELSRRAADLEQLADSAQNNPLRHTDRLQELPDQVTAIRNDIGQVDAELENMLAELEADRRAIVAAREQDGHFLGERLRLERADASALTMYLLRDEIARPLDELLGWLRWTRTVAPVDPAPRRAARGEDMLFAGCRPSPTLLVRALDLHGASRLGSGEPVELRGMLTDFTSTPSAHDKPIRLRMKSSGSQSIELQAIIDRTGSIPRDELIVSGSRIVLPQLELGHTEQLSLTLAPSEAALACHLVISGDALDGQIQLVQKRVQATAVLSGNLRSVPLSAALGDTLRKADGLTLRIALSGTLAEPQYRLSSSVGPAVAEAMELALVRAAEDRAQQLLAQAKRQVDERLAALERTVVEQNSELMLQLAGARGDLEKIASQQSAPRRLSHEQLGRRLPANSLFR